MYEGELWPGQTTKVQQDRLRVKCFQKAAAQGSIWRWPDKPDEGLYQIGDVEREIKTPLDIRSSLSELLHLTICTSRYILCSLFTIFFNKFRN